MKVKNINEMKELGEPKSYKDELYEYLKYLTKQSKMNTSYLEYILEKFQELDIDEEYDGPSLVSSLEKLANSIACGIESSEKLASSMDTLFSDKYKSHKKIYNQRNFNIDKLINNTIN